MAFRSLLKIKINPNLPLRFLLNSPSVLTRSVAPIAQPESSQLFLNNSAAFLDMTSQNLFARHMGTSKSSSTPRGSLEVSDEEDSDDFDDDVDFDGADIDDAEHDFDDDEEDEEAEEEPPRKK